jgi:hypothetical protein
MKTIKVFVTLLALLVGNNFVAFGQEVEIRPWKNHVWNIGYQDKERLQEKAPSAEEEVTADNEFWVKIEGSDSLFAIRPSDFGFRKDYSYERFIRAVLSAGYVPAPKQALVEIYLKDEEERKTFHLATTPITKGNKSFVYAVGPNSGKDLTPTQKEHDLFLKDKSRLGYLDLWLFVKKK